MTRKWKRRAQINEMKKIKMDYNFYLGPGKLRPKELKARSVTCRH